MSCRRNSGEYGPLVFGIANTSRVSRKVSTEPGQLQAASYMRVE